jgi:hypothetical protein
MQQDMGEPPMLWNSLGFASSPNAGTIGGMTHSDDEDDDAYREDPGPEDADWDDETDTVPCPYCQKQIAGESEWCPHCGKYISQEGLPSDRKPIWLIAAVVILLLIILTWITRL